MLHFAMQSLLSFISLQLQNLVDLLRGELVQLTIHFLCLSFMTRSLFSYMFYQLFETIKSSTGFFSYQEPGRRPGSFACFLIFFVTTFGKYSKGKHGSMAADGTLLPMKFGSSDCECLGNSGMTSNGQISFFFFVFCLLFKVILGGRIILL